MEDTKLHNFSLDSFKNAMSGMVATSDRSYDSWSTHIQTRERIRDYTPEKIEQIINSGSLQEQQELSANYFYKNGFYKRIILYYATLLKYVGILIPHPGFGKNLSTQHIQKRYYNAVDFVENMNLPKLCTECGLRALRDGTYYGIITVLNKSTISLMDLPPQYCCSRFKDSNGSDIIEFDVRYFDSIPLAADRNAALASYPKIISRHYKAYKEGKKKNWVMIPTDIGICIPFLDGRPFFLNVIPATLQYDDAVDIEQQRNLEEIKKIIVQKIPHLSDGQLLFEPDEAVEIHGGTVAMMSKNKNTSILTTYADVDAITSQGSSEAAANGLDNMRKNVYNEAGVSSQLFAADGSNTLQTSIKNDIALMMYLANKFATFVTNIVNSQYSNGNISFKYQFLPVSVYNEDEYVTSAFKLAQSGYSLLYPAVALGVTQRDLINLKNLENDVLNLNDILIPPKSAYTQSSSDESKGATDEGGAPPLSDEEKADKTLEKEQSLDNQAKE